MRERLVAFIHESQCLGCAQCSRVCPVDSIVGASGLMHTVLADQCVGCELCVPACPANCIVLEKASQGMIRDAADTKKHAADRKARILKKQPEAHGRFVERELIFDTIARLKPQR